MSVLEQQLIEHFGKLNDAQQLQVLEYVLDLTHADPVAPPQISMNEWLERADAFRAELRANHGASFRVDVQSLLDEVREERLDDIMDRR